MKNDRIVVLHNWSTVCSPINPPCFMYLRGVVSNHQLYDDGQEVITSPVSHVRGRFVYTMSGNRYRLGRVDPLYRKWMKKQYPLWNFRYPLAEHTP